MLRHRVIPTLLLRNGGLVKTVKFKDAKYVGDPINAIRIFNEKEVDELMVLDITATKDGKEPDYTLIEQFAGECFMPLAYGGGIQSKDQAKRLFSLGIEKVCLQTAALKDPSLITSLAQRFGSQSVMVSIDLKKNMWGKPQIFTQLASKQKKSWIDTIKSLESAGAGEILLNSVDKDGTMSGPDLSIIKEASEQLDIPLIAVGGVSSLEDIKACVINGASAVAAGSYFVFQGPHRAVLISYPKYDVLTNLFESHDA